MLWKKYKKKVDTLIEDIQTQIEERKSRGDTYICMPIGTFSFEKVSKWCETNGYEIKVDHITEDAVFYYKISW